MIHLSHRSESKAALIWVGVLAVILGMVSYLPTPEQTRGLASYLPLHTGLEMLSMVIGSMIFAIVWSTHTYSAAARLLILGSLALGVSVLDFMHALSYQGMPDLVTPSGTEKAINFWLIARSLVVAGLLFVAWVPHRADHWLEQRSPWIWLGSSLLLVAVGTVWFLYFPHLVPRTFLPDTGLTTFKIVYEYILIFLFLVAAVGFCRHLPHPCQLSASNLIAASVIFAMSEYFFTLYTDVTDVYNLSGHVYKVIGFVFLYRAIFLRVVQQPFHDLNEARTDLQMTVDTLPDRLIEVRGDGTVLRAHVSRRLKMSEADIFQENVNPSDILSGPCVQRYQDALQEAKDFGHARNVRIEIPKPDGTSYVDLSIAMKPMQKGAPVTFLMLARDITEQVIQQRKLAFESKVTAFLLHLENKADSESEAVSLRTVVDGAQSLTGSTFAFIHLFDNDLTASTLVVSTQTTEGLELLREVWEPVVTSKRALIVNEPDHVAARISATHAQLVERFVSVPVLDADQVQMVLSVGNKESQYSKPDVDALVLIAEALWKRVKSQRREKVIRRLLTALGQSPYPVLITDTQSRIEYVNDAFSRVSGYEPDELIGKTPHILRSGETPIEVYQEMWNKIKAGLTWQGELINRRKDGTTYIEKAVIYPARNSRGEITNYVAHKEDITHQREAEGKLYRLANYDQLTGLVNREVLERRLKQFIESPNEADLPLTVLWLNLDNFKSVNDSLGHDSGNLLLAKVSNRLREELGEQVTLSRVSGDGFVALLPHVDQQTATLVARQLLDAIQKPVRLKARQLSVSGSIGMSIFPNDSDTVTGLLMKAETAMYRVKLEGRNGLRFFSHDMQEHSLRALEIASSLKQANMDEEFYLVYQPQLSLHDHCFVGAEALIRWSHPVWGQVEPGEFIPIAEQSGKILEIGDWVLKDVTRQVKQWRDEKLGDFSVAVNLSALQFVQTDMVTKIVSTATNAEVPSGCIEIELTESVALNNPLAAGQAISALHNAGFRVSIDDFGTGYSSMSYLKRFAVNKLKIDRSFIQDLESDKDDRAIVMAIVQMAHSLGIKTIAEGVETQAQLAILKAKGCDEIQGYYYSKPLRSAEFEAFIRTQKRKRIDE